MVHDALIKPHSTGLGGEAGQGEWGETERESRWEGLIWDAALHLAADRCRDCVHLVPSLSNVETSSEGNGIKSMPEIIGAWNAGDYWPSRALPAQTIP